MNLEPDDDKRSSSDRAEGAATHAQALIDALQDVLIAMDAEGRVTAVYGPGAGKTRFAAEDVLGRNELDAQTAEDDRRRATVLETLRGGLPVRYTWQQGRRTYQTTAAPEFDADGEVVGIVALRSDVTEVWERERNVTLRHRALFERSTSVMLLIDSRTGEIVDANPAALAFYGYSHGEMTNLRISQINTLSGHEVYVEMQRARQLQRRHFEFQHRLKDGSIRDVHSYVAPIDIEGRELLYSIVHDVTDQVRAEEALRLRSAALEAAANGVVITDVSGSIAWVNPAVERMTGYARHELIGENPRLFKSGVQPEAYYRDLWATIAAGEVWRGSLENRRKDGSTYLEEMTISPISDATGVVTHYVAIKQDVTEQRRLKEEAERSEAWWRALLEHDSDLFGVLDTDGTYRYLSPSVERILGYTAEELTGTVGFDLVHPEDVDRVRRSFAEKIAHVEEDEPVLMRFRHKDGSWPVIEAVFTNALDDPSIRGVIVNARDITSRVRTEEQRRLLESVVVHARDAVLITDTDLGPEGPRIMYVNPSFTAITGYEPAEVIGKTPRILQGPKTDRLELDRVHQALRNGEAIRAQLVNYGKDGRTYVIELDIAPIRNQAGMITNFVSVQRDISQRLESEAHVRRFREFRETLSNLVDEALQGPTNTALLQRLLDYAVQVVPGAEAGSVLLVDDEGGATFVAFHGYSSELLDVRFTPEDVGTDFERNEPWIRHRYEPSSTLDPNARALLFGKAGRASEIRASLKVPVWIEGVPRAQFNLDNLASPDAFGEEAMDMARLFGRQLGVMLQRLDLEEVLVEQATIDTLTGLPNRRKAEALLQEALEDAKRHGTRGALFLLDVHNFGAINDAYGHAVGDQLLQVIGARLANVTSKIGTLGRWAGDEFIVVCTDAQDTERLQANARDMQAAFEQPFRIADTTIDVRVTMGVSVFPAHAETPSDVIHEAHMALHAADRAGDRTFVLYEPGIREAFARRRDVETALQKAIQEARIHLHYQPRFELRSHRMVATEALARWTDARLGPISPGEFIPIAEESDLIHALGALVLDQACAQAKAWLVAGTPRLVAVNLSLKQLRQESLVEDVRRTLETHGLPSQWLELEITESAAMSNVRETIETLTELHDLGIRLAIDDFGTAYSSLSHLKLMPIDALKIDQSFVKDLPDDPTKDPIAASIVQAVVALGKSMNLKIIAEGVETQAQERFLTFLGCDEAQGYHLGKPAPADALPTHDMP